MLKFTNVSGPIVLYQFFNQFGRDAVYFFAHFFLQAHKLIKRYHRPCIDGIHHKTKFLFIFFSVSRSKLPSYLLPTAPAFAMLLAPTMLRMANLQFGRLLAATGIAPENEPERRELDVAYLWGELAPVPA